MLDELCGGTDYGEKGRTGKQGGPSAFHAAATNYFLRQTDRRLTAQDGGNTSVWCLPQPLIYLALTQ